MFRLKGFIDLMLNQPLNQNLLAFDQRATENVWPGARERVSGW